MRICGWQKIFIAGLIALLVFARVELAGPLPSQLFTTLAWEASPSPEVTGYAVYYHVAGLSITNRLDVGEALTVTIPLLVGSAYSIQVVAYTAEGIESEPCNGIQYTPPPLTPMRLIKQDDGTMQVRFRTSPLAVCQVEWTDNLAVPGWYGSTILRAGLNGDVIFIDSSARSAPMRFYRATKL